MDRIIRNIILIIVNKHFPYSKTGRKRVCPEFVLDKKISSIIIKNNEFGIYTAKR